MQAAETVYEFGSSPDEEDDDNNIHGNDGQSSSPHQNKPNLRKKTHHQSSINQLQQSQQQPTSITGTNLRPNKTSSTSINQKLNTSFSSLSDNQPPSSSHSPSNPKNQSKTSSNLIRHHLDHGNNDISSSDDQLLLNDNNNKLVTSNTSNTSLSSATTSSRGNISQSGPISVHNQSLNVLSQTTTTITKGAQASGASSGSGSSQQQSQNPNFDSNVISERVKNLATQIYQELKRIISRCNYDEDILSGLMPLIVRVLESLDLALIENQQLQVELELCKDDNEQLVIMFEKEKAAKRAIDKKLIESEYAYEEERQQYQQKIESLDNVVKLYELKAKNASDQATRFEEKEAERKKEYNKLHDRYTELLKSHCDVVERFRHLIGNNEAVANLTTINVPPQQMVASSSDLTDVPSLIGKINTKQDDFNDHGASSIRTNALKSWNAETELTLEDASLVVIDEMLEQQKTGDGSSQNESSGINETTSVAAGAGFGEHEKESENDSIAYTSMEKEFRKLIQENKDLSKTKNALNVVKDDLIAEVDRLTNEVSMYEQAVEQLNATKDQMKQKVFSLDSELRKTKEELEKAKQKIRENNEEGVPYSQRKRFGRAEMAKVLMERNSYKERFMELQDAVRYTELVRANNKVETEKRSGLWKFFSNLFGAPPREPLAIGPGGQTISRNSSPVVSYHGSTAIATSTAITASDQQVLASTGVSNQYLATTTDATSLLRGSVIGVGGSVSGGGSVSSTIRTTNQRLSSNSDLIVLMDSDLNIDRNHMFRSSVDGRVNSDLSGYIHAYGWSLPASSVRTLKASSSTNSIGTIDNNNRGLLSGGNGVGGVNLSYLGPDSLSNNFNQSASILDTTGTKLSGLQVPIPQYCRPLTGDSLGMKIWCATAIDLSGGYNAPTSTTTTTTIIELPDNTTSTTEFISSSKDVSLTTDDSINIPGTTESTVNISTSTPIKSSSTNNQQQQALRQLEKEVDQALKEDPTNSSNLLLNSTSSKLPILKATTEMVLSNLPMADDAEELSSCVWICSTQHSRSKITIIDIKTKPNELLDSFYVPTFLYSIKSIPGCKQSDLPGITSLSSTARNNDDFQPQKINNTLNMINELISTQKREFYRLIEVDLEAGNRLRSNRKEAAKIASDSNKNNSTTKTSTTTAANTNIHNNDDESINHNSLEQETEEANKVAAAAAAAAKNNNNSSIKQPVSEEDAEISRILDNDVSVGVATLQKLNDFVAHIQPAPTEVGTDVASNAEEKLNVNMIDDSNKDSNTPKYQDVVYYQPISTSLSTVWMGGKDSVLYIHSAIGQWKDCVACIKLPDSILQICHFRGKVFVALADGSLCVFFRNIETKQWEFSQYLLIDINLMADVANDSITTTTTTSTLHSSSLANQQSRTISISESRYDSANKTNISIDQGNGNIKDSSTTIDKQNETTTSTTENTPTKLQSLNNLSTISSMKKLPRAKVAGIRCLEIANRNLWVGYKNRVLIIDPISLKLKHSFNVVPQVDNQIRQLISMKDGVFVCLRSDLILRLYSSIKPYQHIQNIDIEPVVTRLISPKTFVISHITAMKVADNTLWIGNAHGIILTIPCKLVPQISEAPLIGPNGEFDETPSSLSIARFVPKCDITSAQISFHGHKDSVKFFIHAHNLMLSGGQGYLDFRLDMDDQSKSISDKSHLILWQLPN